MFASVQALLARLPEERFPTCEDLNRLASELAGLCSKSGAPIRFVAPGRDSQGASCYEQRVYETGEVETREGSWHDLFNALVWLAFPKTKAALNQRHIVDIRASRAPVVPGRRGTVRDVLTLFDESGVIVLCSKPEFGQQLRGFEWKALFWTARRAAATHLRYLLFGHSLLEKALAPYPAVTGRALIIDVSDSNLLETEVHTIDALAASALGAADTLRSTRSLAPLPIMGVPGWWRENEHESFYDDVAVFRPSRKSRGSTPLNSF